MTVTSFAFAYLVFKIMGWRESQGTTHSEQFVASIGWVAWKAAASITVTLWTFLFVSGLREVMIEARGSKYRLVLYTVSALAISLIVYLIAATEARFDFGIPVRLRRVRIGGLVPVGVLTSIPWIVLVWVTYARAADLRERCSAVATAGHPNFGETIRELLGLWRLLSSCIVTFVSIVAAGLLTTGALRNAYLQQFEYGSPEAAAFPAAAVLIYGAFFAAALTGLALPLLRAWTASASALVECAHPLPADGKIDEEWEQDRRRLERVLRLDSTPLRNPLTSLSFVTPLATAAFATFVPQIAI